ncbi:3-oxoacyl-(acyl-carrier-protein) synthase [Haloferula luteola]|uniref:3-oxoacyl-(Acyl-carrier-protein) synthase n=1 Tax=Haloferula luteola TaxID=595692 RepID=A0A840UWC1_9BACT|nr:beta-ketoacyl synthase N-terminal-like domain-containing protein [Haloferula luteola]MBB5350025.1 3-oxoacyl-(acyl-carrier-protein) synthase [Haloferula luteola]
MAPSLTIRGTACLTCLGDDLAVQAAAVQKGQSGLRPLAELDGSPADFSDLQAGWIQDRSRLAHRIWSPLSMAALIVAQQAVASSGWRDLHDVPIFFATSRGSVAGVREPWPGRRPTPLMTASNSLPAEPAAAISSEWGTHAPWQTVSSGCCAGLDALHLASVWLRSGEAQRALVVAADLPLTHSILQDYDTAGILAHGGGLGMHPSEGAAALCLESTPSGEGPELVEMLSLSEPEARFGGNRPLPLLAEALAGLASRHGKPDLLVPHASGTAKHKIHETQAIEAAWSQALHLATFKQATGHCVGASALIEVVLGLELLPAASSLLKIASALGGKHSCAWIRRS